MNETTNDGLLWHYTSQEGLLGILQSKKLWATDILYLNDSREYHHGFGIVADLLEENITESADTIDQRFIDYLKDALEERRPSSTNRRPDTRFFVFSLSALRNDLSQWRAYCPQGIGFSIGFEAERLHSGSREFTLWLVECVYDDTGLKREFAERLDRIVARFRELYSDDLHPGARNSLLNSARSELFNAFPQHISRLKDPAFDAERESRLVATVRGLSGERVLCRKGKSNPIPYGEIEISSFGAWPIREIVVGPCPHPELAEMAVVDALQDANIDYGGIEQTKVTRSDIPYRNW